MQGQKAREESFVSKCYLSALKFRDCRFLEVVWIWVYITFFLSIHTFRKEMCWVNQMCGMGCALGYIHQVEDLI